SWPGIGIKADEARILGMGHDFEWLLINARGGAKAASAAARARLAARPVDGGGVGGGGRGESGPTPVLGARVNTQIGVARGARVAFNTSPTDTAEAIERISDIEP